MTPKTILRASIALVASMIAVFTMAAPSHAINQVDDAVRYSNGQAFYVDYQGTRQITAAAYIIDPRGDSACTTAYVRVLDRNWDQIGNWVAIGSVCNGNTVVERPVTASRDIYVVQTSIGNESYFCLRNSDGGEACR